MSGGGRRNPGKSLIESAWMEIEGDGTGGEKTFFPEDEHRKPESNEGGTEG